jgi:hypothetical protein
MSRCFMQTDTNVCLCVQVYDSTGRYTELRAVWVVPAVVGSPVFYFLLCCHGKVFTVSMKRNDKIF